MADALINRLKTEPTPFIDDDTVTFVWKGKTAPQLVGDFTGWDTGTPISMRKAGSGLWTFQMPFLPDAYIEYGFKVGNNSLPDPYNPRQTSNGIGGFNNYFPMPHYRASRLSRKKRAIAHGLLRKFDVSTDYFIYGKKRTVRLYQPPVEKAVPLLVVWDGQDYLNRIHLNYIVDNLIAKRKIQPIALACVDNGGEEVRTAEYACSDASLAFVVYSVLPLAQRELNLLDPNSFPGAYGVMGSSMGGLMALYTSLRFPQVFGKVLSQSGAFSFGNFDTVVFDLVRGGEKCPAEIWLDVGLYDLRGLLEANQKMRDLLSQKGCSMSYREYHAGHNFPAWRDDLWRGLVALFGA